MKITDIIQRAGRSKNPLPKMLKSHNIVIIYNVINQTVNIYNREKK